MTLTAPGALWLLAALAALAAAYLLLQARPRRYELRFTNLALLDVVAPERPGWRRHVSAATFLLGLGALVLAAARPVAEVEVPVERATVVLAIDVSLSMAATDVAPTRWQAAQVAARDFVEALPEPINLGLVAFDGVARVLVTPTTDRATLRAAIDNLRLGPATAIGEAIFASLEAIQNAPAARGEGPAPAHIVLMSDGQTTVGRPDTQGAAAAAAAGVPVSTIAFGTPYGEIVTDTSPAPIPVPVAPEPLREIAATTGGSAFQADTLADLAEIYQDIGSSIGTTTEEQELTHRAVQVGIALLLAAAAMSLAWFARLP